MKRSGYVDAVKVFFACLLLLVAFVAMVWIKLDAYGGDASCLVVRCVKVIR